MSDTGMLAIAVKSLVAQRAHGEWARVVKRGGASMLSLSSVPTAQTDVDGDEPIKVLAVDDNETNLELLRAQLEHAGCEVIAVDNGTDALRHVMGSDFDVIVLDVMMPNVTG